LANQLQSDSVGHILNHLFKHKVVDFRITIAYRGQVGIRKAVDEDAGGDKTIVKQRESLLGATKR